MTEASTGRVVGQRYRIEREIASGGMGTVYEAKHTLSQKTVALKVLHPEAAHDDQARQRFLREVAAPARIGHDGICEVYDAGIDDDGAPFVAMELLQGETLRERLTRPGLSFDDKIGYFHELLGALSAAHAKNLVHRDLKPENVFLSRRRDGREVLKLLDFGIVRELSDSNVTQAGVGMGTPDYMSPEQATNAKDVTARTDVWSVGVMMYEALAGEPPFRGNTPSAIVVDVITRPHAPLRSVEPSVSPTLSDLIDRCLSKDPKGRPEDAGALLDALKEAHRITATLPKTVASPAVVSGAPNAAAAGPFNPPSPSHPYGHQGPHPGAPAPVAAAGYGTPPAYGSTPGVAYGAAPGPSFGSSAYGATGPKKKSGCGVIGLLVALFVVGVPILLGGGVFAAWAMGAFGPGTGRLRINTNITGGELMVDGESLGVVENHQILDVEAGPHQVELRHAGTLVASQSVTVEKDGFADALLHRVADTSGQGTTTEAVSSGQAQVLEGSLGPGDGTLTSGEYRDVYQFQWSTGTPIDITAESSSFDAYLIHRSPSGAQFDDDDGGDGTNARIQTVSKEDGTHTIMVTSFQSGEAGAYTLRVVGSAPVGQPQ